MHRKHSKYLITVILVWVLLFQSGCGKGNQGKENTQSAGMSMPQITVERDNEDSEAVVGEFIEDTEAPEDKGMLYRDKQKEIAGDAINILSTTSLHNNAFLMPILQNPTEDTVTVQWFTETEGDRSEVLLYESEDSLEPIRTIDADTRLMSRIRGGKTEKKCNDPNIRTDIYKHVAVVDNLPEYHGYMSERVYYRIKTDESMSDMYTLAAAAAPGTPMRVLLTSDLQIKNMCAANYQKVFEKVGHVDAVLCDGDLVDVIDRAYDWFYADNAFFRVFTGTASDEINGSTYYGAPFLQEAPLYTAIGNHDVMGVLDNSKDLAYQFNNPSTRSYAEFLRMASSQTMNEEEAERYIEDHSYNTITYEEILELPRSSEGNEKYYATSIGDIRLVSLYVSRVWRLPNVGIQGKYSELPGATPNLIGNGDFIFESIKPDSTQIKFFKNETSKEEFKNAKYKLVMFHQESHSLGDNSTPAFTDPVESTITDPVTGLPMVIYNYPIDKDYITGVIEPIAESAGTNLMFNAHSHLWNRFVTKNGMHVLETSNVGNSYGAFMNGDTPASSNPASGRARNIPTSLIEGDKTAIYAQYYPKEYYPLTGDPAGLEPVVPSISKVPGNDAYVASNTITVFSILDTESGNVESYYFDTEKSDSEVVKFDEFNIVR